MTESASKNILQLVIGAISGSFLTLIFWYLLAKTTTVEIVGTLAAIVNLSILIVTISNFQIPFGVKRYLGKAVSQKDFKEFRSFSSAALLLTSIFVIVTIAILSIPNFSVLDVIGLDSDYLPFIIILIVFLSFQYLFSEILVSANLTKKVTSSIILGTALRLILLFILVSVLLWESLGGIISFISASIISTALLALYLMKNIPFNKNLITHFKQKYVIIIKASIPKYIPDVFFRISLHTGVLIVFAFQDVGEAGIYYVILIALSFFLSISFSINSVLHPKISGLDFKNQILFTSRSIYLSYLFLMPFVSIFFVYYEDMLNLVGDEYSTEGLALPIIMISLLGQILWAGIFHLSHAKGRYRDVYILGGTQAFVSVLSYVILVPIYSVQGAAMAFTLGSLGAVIVSIFISNQLKIPLEYTKYAMLIVIPLGIIEILYLINMYFVLSYVITIMLTFLIYIKIGLFTQKELKLIFESIGIDSSTSFIYCKIDSLMNKINFQKEESYK